MQITLRGIKAGMNECVTLVIEATPHSRVGAVATNFAATHLRARGIVSISRDTVAVDPTAVVDDALERDAVYDVVLKPDRDEVDKTQQDATRRNKTMKAFSSFNSFNGQFEGEN